MIRDKAKQIGVSPAPTATELEQSESREPPITTILMSMFHVLKYTEETILKQCTMQAYEKWKQQPDLSKPIPGLGIHFDVFNESTTPSEQSTSPSPSALILILLLQA